MSQQIDTVFPKEYYDCCTLNSGKKKSKWFCNRNLDSVVLLTALEQKNDKDGKKSFQNEKNNPVRTNTEAHISRPLLLVNTESKLYESENHDTELNKVVPSPQSKNPGEGNSILGEVCEDRRVMSSPESVVYDSDRDPEYIVTSSASEESDSEAESIQIEVQENIVYSKAIQSEIQNDVVGTSYSDKPASKKSKKHQNFCYFCETSVLNFARHLTRNHKSEIEVQKMLSLPPNNKKRKELLSSLRKKGNYLKDCEEGKPVRESYIQTLAVPCTYCLGFYSKKNLWRHRKNCTEKPKTNEASTSGLTDAQNLTTRHLKIDPQLRQKVFPHMRADKISLVAKKDVLICAYGARYMKIHREKHFISVTSRKMRELARILIEMRTLHPEIKTLFHALRPQYYDDLIKVTKIISGFDEETEIYQSPTFAMNAGTTLKQCCDIAITFALKKSEAYGSVSMANVESDLRTLIQLIQAQWKFDVSSQACNDLNSKRWNKVTLIPLASDLKLLKEYLISTANKALSELQKNNKNRVAFSQLLETIFCRIILLNRKRPGELQRLLVKTYTSSIANENSQQYEEFTEAVSEAEKTLMKSFKRIVIRGKRGRGVPVLFTKDVEEQLTMVLNLREEINKVPNIYLFGNPNSDQPLIGYKIVKKYAEACGAKNPNAITCTRLRKHLATLTQLFSMSETDMEQLASFMGHTLNVHRSSYRLPDDIYQTAKISKLLLLMEKGEAGRFKGKTLEQIDFNLEEDLLEEENHPSIHQETIEQSSSQITEQEQESLIETEKEFETMENSGVNHSLEKIPPSVSKKSTNKKRVLVPWTEEQKKVVTAYFKNHIKNKKPPKRGECEELINLNAQLLKNKDWVKIKVFVQNKYTNKMK